MKIIIELPEEERDLKKVSYHMKEFCKLNFQEYKLTIDEKEIK